MGEERNKAKMGDDSTNTTTITTTTTTTTTDNDCSYQEAANRLYKGAALAPMVRASTTPLRALALHYGAGFVYTEELVDRSITNTMRVVNEELGTIDYVKDISQLSKKTRKKLAKQNNRPCLLLRIDPSLEKGKLVCQLGSGEPELALAAAKHLYRDVAAIDINMGCPKKFSVSGGMGSALLSDPERAARIIATLRKEIPRPVSCKIRLLKTAEDTIRFVETMISAGANAVAIHARRVGHDSIVKADWDTLRSVLTILRDRHPNFPFLVNGDFYDRQELQDLLQETGANGVLLGRPALYNTSMFRKLPQPLEDKTKVVQEYTKLSAKYDIHYKNAKYVICEMMNNRRAPTERVPYLPQEFPNGQTIAKTCSCTNMEQIFKVWDMEFAATTTTITTTKATATTTVESKQEVLAPGEHRYEDSYFLKNSKREDNAETQEEPNRKRQKTISSNNG